MTPKGYRIERGLLWPATDVGAAAVLFAGVADLAVAYRHCREFNVAVQAGGNCGIWPKDLGKKFRVVYTFEPDPMNFRCLCANAPAENVFKFNAGLGAGHRTTSLLLRPDNVGAHQIGGAGDIPMLRIDDLALAACDLICLDVEGFELNALIGALETIERFQPTIVVEDKGVAGVKQGQVVSWLVHGMGYSVAEKVSKDVILVR
jgi:FkbM family methyltransferase